MNEEATVDVKAARKYFDGLCFSGTADDVRLDHQILNTLARRTRLKGEGALAGYVHLRLRDESFQSSLARLESRGLITRKVREWGFEGKWIELSDELREAIITNKGSFFGSQSLTQLGVDH